MCQNWPARSLSLQIDCQFCQTERCLWPNWSCSGRTTSLVISCSLWSAEPLCSTVCQLVYQAAQFWEMVRVSWVSEVCGNANISFNQHPSHSKDTLFFRLMTHVVQDLLNFSILLDKINILFTGHLDKVFPTVFRCQELNRFQCYWQASHGFCLIWI